MIMLSKYAQQSLVYSVAHLPRTGVIVRKIKRIFVILLCPPDTLAGRPANVSYQLSLAVPHSLLPDTA